MYAHRVLAGLSVVDAASILKITDKNLIRMETGSSKTEISWGFIRRFDYLMVRNPIEQHGQSDPHELKGATVSRVGHPLRGHCDEVNSAAKTFRLTFLAFGFQDEAFFASQTCPVDQDLHRQLDYLSKEYERGELLRHYKTLYDLAYRSLQEEPSPVRVRAVHMLAHWELALGHVHLAHGIVKESLQFAIKAKDSDSVGWSKLHLAVTHRFLPSHTLKSSLEEFRKVEQYLNLKQLIGTRNKSTAALTHTLYREILALLVRESLRVGAITREQNEYQELAHTYMAKLEKHKVSPQELREYRLQRDRDTVLQCRAMFLCGSLELLEELPEHSKGAPVTVEMDQCRTCAIVLLALYKRFGEVSHLTQARTECMSGLELARSAGYALAENLFTGLATLISSSDPSMPRD